MNLNRCMPELFRAFDGRLLLAYHRPNGSPNERPYFIPVQESAESLKLA
jgi:arabinan endo-1,5-alpha-L-arabinosidase